MALITIQCRLNAPETTRRRLWSLMVEKNTPLINELLKLMVQDPNFPDWCQKGKLPADRVHRLCQCLESDSRFQGQPDRFYSSAVNHVNYILKSYIQIQNRLIFKLEGNKRWQKMLKSDSELEQDCQSSITAIRLKAEEILKKLQESDNLIQNLFKAYDKEKHPLAQAAICYLIKNGCKVAQKPEDAQKLAERRRQLEIRIEKLEKQINNSKVPRGRVLDQEKWLSLLSDIKSIIPATAEQEHIWQNQLLAEPSLLPYPLIYKSNGDLTWGKDEQNRLFVKFKGLAKFPFQIYCDQRQLKWFERFYQDQEVKKNSHDQHSAALFTLRSTILSWQECTGKGKPWQNHRLTLYCSLDTLLETAEGTELVRQEKTARVKQSIAKMKEKPERTKEQENLIKAKESTLDRINNTFPRPSKPLYQGDPAIIVGVSVNLEQPATVAVVNVVNREVLIYRSTRQLLGEKYSLLNKWRNQRQQKSHKRHKAQKNSNYHQYPPSNLGEYLDRLLAKAIVELAKSYQASSIVVPQINPIRESAEIFIKMKAEVKVPGCLEAQKQYTKKYMQNIHYWSYGRLVDNIICQSAKIGIHVEKAKQSVEGTPQEKAKNLVTVAYKNRSIN